jgi:DNA-binding FadR family transcriptional regulator
MTIAGARPPEGRTDQVVSFVRELIERGRLRPGERLPAERNQAQEPGAPRRRGSH